MLDDANVCHMWLTMTVPISIPACVSLRYQRSDKCSHRPWCHAQRSSLTPSWMLAFKLGSGSRRLSQWHTHDRFHCSTEAKGHGQPGLILTFVPSVQVSVVAMMKYIDNERLWIFTDYFTCWPDLFYQQLSVSISPCGLLSVNMEFQQLSFYFKTFSAALAFIMCLFTVKTSYLVPGGGLIWQKPLLQQTCH